MARVTRILGFEDMRRLLPMDAVLDMQRAAFEAQTAGTVTVAPNGWLRLPEPRRAWLKLLAGHEARSGALGVKVLARFPENPPGRNLGGIVLLFDEADGFPLAVMDAVYLTAVRTGAGAGLALAAMAPQAAHAGVVGTGVVAWYSLVAMVAAGDGLRSVAVQSRSAERREAFAARCRDELGLDAVAVATVDEAVDGIDVLLTATNAPEPVVFERHVRPGLHVNAMGIRTELDPAVLTAARVIPDGRAEAIGDGKFSVALAAGAVDEDALGPELGAVLSGAAPGREHAGQITLFDSSGVAVQDVVCARVAWERAEAEDLGVIADLGSGDPLARPSGDPASTART